MICSVARIDSIMSLSVGSPQNHQMKLTGPAFRLFEIQCRCSRPGNLSGSFGLESMNMGNGERAGSRGRSDWPVRIGGVVGGAAGATVALFVVKPLIDLPFWLGPIAFVAVVVAGIVLGQLAGWLLLRPSSGGPPDDKKGTTE